MMMRDTEGRTLPTFESSPPGPPSASPRWRYPFSPRWRLRPVAERASRSCSSCCRRAEPASPSPTACRRYGVHILTYMYYYDGGGVAVGDVNNDGLPDLYFTSNVGPNRLYLTRGIIGSRTSPSAPAWPIPTAGRPRDHG